MGGIAAARPGSAAAGGAGGRVTNDVWVTASPDGAAWNTAVAAGGGANGSAGMWSARQGLVGLSFGGSLWVLGGVATG